MQQVLVINDDTAAGKTLLETARLLAKSNKGSIAFIDEKVIAEIEDNALLKQMQLASTTGLLSEKEKIDFINGLRKKTAK